MNARVSRAGVVSIVLVCAAACSPGAAPPASPSPATVSAASPGAARDTALRTGEHFLDLAMAAPYTPKPPNGGTDEYRCVLLDPHLTAPAFLTGARFQPQNANLVHHATFYRIAPADVAQAKALDAASPGEGWTCFGGTGVRGNDAASQQAGAAAAWIASWAPGVGETVLRTGFGYQLAPGTQIIMEVHYSLLASGTQHTGSDRSGIRLRLADPSTGDHPLQVMLLVAPVDLPCAPDESGELCDRAAAIRDLVHRFGAQAQTKVDGLNYLCYGSPDPQPGPTQHCDYQVTEPGTVYAAGPHMHLLGRSLAVALNPDSATPTPLLDVPVYNFDNQSAYELPNPVALKPGDTLRVRCTYDVTLRQKLPLLRNLPPRYVVWGDGTSDEMCLGIVIWYRP